MNGRTKKIKVRNAILKDYKRVVISPEVQTINIEWSRKGDNFKKLSVYNNSYKTVPTLTSNLGTTILLKNLV